MVMMIYLCYYDNRPDFTSHNSSSSGGSGLVSPTGVTLSLSGHHESSQSAGEVCYMASSFN